MVGTKVHPASAASSTVNMRLESFVAGVYGERFPTSLVLLTKRAKEKEPLFYQLKTAATEQKAILRDKVNQLRDPYDPTMKLRLEDSARTDPVVKAAILRKVQFTLGKRTKTVLDVIDDVPWLEELVREKRMQQEKYKEENRLREEEFQRRLQRQQEKQRQIENQNQEENSEGKPFPLQLRSTSDQETQSQREAQVHLRLAQDELRMEDQQELPNNNGNANKEPLFTQLYEWEQQTTGAIGGQDEEPMLDIDKLRRQALEVVMSNREYIDMKNEIDRVDRKVKFHHKLFASVFQSFVAGRSALYVESQGDPDGLPTDLKVLNPFRLGEVQMNPDTWALEWVRYLDFDDEHEKVMASQMIYLPNLDIHISPDSLYYGLSDIEPVVHISETNRIMDDEDFKEIARSAWAASGIMHVDTKDMGQMENVTRNLQPNLLTFTNLDFKFQEVNLPNMLDKLVNLRSENDKRILRGLEVPSPLIGFEDVTNRATMAYVLMAWKESVLDSKRTWLRDLIEPQWYDTLVGRILNENVDEMKIKVKMAFEDIALESFEDRGELLLKLYINGVIPLEKILEAIDMEDVIEEMRLLKEKQEREKALQNKLTQQALSQGAAAGGLVQPGAGGGTLIPAVINEENPAQSLIPKERATSHEQLLRKTDNPKVVPVVQASQFRQAKAVPDNSLEEQIQKKKLELLNKLVGRVDDLI